MKLTRRVQIKRIRRRHLNRHQQACCEHLSPAPRGIVNLYLTGTKERCITKHGSQGVRIRALGVQATMKRSQCWFQRITAHIEGTCQPGGGYCKRWELRVYGPAIVSRDPLQMSVLFKFPSVQHRMTQRQSKLTYLSTLGLTERSKISGSATYHPKLKCLTYAQEQGMTGFATRGSTTQGFSRMFSNSNERQR